MQDLRLRVLIVEDNPVSRELLRALLRKQGMEVVRECSSARAAIEAAARLRPDLVCLDIGLAEGDGIEVLRQLKSERAGLRVLMVSGASQRSRVREALEAGADGFVVKPYTPATLGAALERVFAPRAAGER